jgi:nucleoside-diphosphate-sugar epimerase
MPRPLTGSKILIAGVTGKVAQPVARALSPDNEVWGLARFGDAATRTALEAAGVRCLPLDLVDGSFADVPDDFRYVLNFSVVKSRDWTTDLDGNAGGLGRLMTHCAGAEAFLHCSSTAVYQPDDHRRFAEDDGLGDNHRPLPGMATYSISKIAAEAMARYCARQLDLPTTIARLNVPYGTDGFWPARHVAAILAGDPIPVHVNAPSEYNPIHLDDIIGMLPGLLAVAAVPATLVNWAGNDVVSIEEWCTYLGELLGREPTFLPTEGTIESVAIDVERLHELVGPAEVGWRDGMARMVVELGVADVPMGGTPGAAAETPSS